MRIRLVAVDLDGTLLNSQWEIPSANLEALEAAAARGVQIVVVTGRRFASARPFIEQLACPLTLIASNGAWIGSLSGEVLHRNFLPCDVARRVLDATREYRPLAVVIFDVPGAGQVTLQANASLEGPLGWYAKNNPECVVQVADLESILDDDPIQVMFGGPPADLAPLEPLLRGSDVRDRIHLTWTKYLNRNVALLDVMNWSCSKGRALKFWSERSGIPASEILALGDNHNDLEMLQFAGQPVLMGNCSPDLARGSWPVTRSNDENGVAAAIAEYVLNAG